MVDKSKNSITNVELTDNRYRIEQNLVRNKYEVTNMNGETVLRGKQKMLKMKEEFPFVNKDGEEAFTVKAQGIMDIAGNYALIDSSTDEQLVVLDEKLSFLVEEWTIKYPESGEEIATIKSKNKVLSALRHLSNIANLVPNKYLIFDKDGEKVGEISGEFSLKDTYTVTLDDSGDMPREPIMAVACVLDALENN